MNLTSEENISVGFSGLPLSTIILAAGRGTRLKSNFAKCMHKIGGFTMLEHCLVKARELGSEEIVCVFSQDGVPPESYLHGVPQAQVMIQREINGTASASLTAKPAISNTDGVVLVMYCDTPLISTQKLREAVEQVASGEYAVSLIGFQETDPNSYGRLVTQGDSLLDIIETKDNPNATDITLCNSGIVAVSAKLIWQLLESVDTNNIYGEYYLTSVVSLAVKAGYKCGYVTERKDLAQGVNSKAELARLEACFQQEKRAEFLKQGVQLIDPTSTYFSLDTKIASGVIVHPQVVFKPKVDIGQDVVIESFTVLEKCIIKEGSIVGPFARIKGHSVIGAHAIVGNFVELQHVELAAKVKIKHLAYVGDTHVGEGSNIGAGVVTCNFNGTSKFNTNIGSGCFVGSNVSLVAPVRIGDNSFVAAGSTIIKDVKPEALGIARSKQTEIPGWVTTKKSKSTT